MDKLLEPLLKSLENDNWAIAFVAVAVALVFNLRPIVEFLERREGRRKDFVSEALKLESVSGASREILIEELNALVFKKITGISASRPLRERLTDLISRAGGEIQMSQLAQAKPHLRMRGGVLSVELTRGDRFEWAVNWILAVLVALLALLMFMLPGAVKGVNAVQLLSLVALGMFLFFFALFMVSQTLPYSVARRIQPIVERLEAALPSPKDA